MRTLKKMSIGELQSDSNVVLLREQMKATKAGRGGNCYIYCGGGLAGLTQDCADGYKFCGDTGWMCSTGQGDPC